MTPISQAEVCAAIGRVRRLSTISARTDYERGWNNAIDRAYDELLVAFTGTINLTKEDAA